MSPWEMSSDQIYSMSSAFSERRQYAFQSRSTRNANANTFIVQSYLGKNADVPLTLILQREESDEFVYENRKNALANMLRRLSERKDEQFNFDSSPTVEYLVPHRGEGENGLYVEKLAYQRDYGLI